MALIKKSKKKSSVISMRISAEERELLEEVMKHQDITRMSDLMRQAIEMVKRPTSSALIVVMTPNHLSMSSNQFG